MRTMGTYRVYWMRGVGVLRRVTFIMPSMRIVDDGFWTRSEFTDAKQETQQRATSMRRGNCPRHESRHKQELRAHA